MFIQVIQGPVAEPEQAHAALDRWASDLAPDSHGWLGTTAGVTDDGTLVAVARFTSKEEARRNSERPEQDAWWRETSRLFTGEVSVHDCGEVDEFHGGGSDTAGFVQVIEGHVEDPGRLRELFHEGEEELAAYRPDLIGSTAAMSEDGTYIETAYFTSEDEARRGERKAPPPELEGALKEYMRVFEGRPAYFDLHRPWMYSPSGQHV
jgi:hypothetical protein